MSEDIRTLGDIAKKMKEFRETNCSGVTASEFAEFCRHLALIVPREQGMRRGIVALLGELWACVRFGLKLMPQGNKGYDAVDLTGRLGQAGKRYQIKSRHPEKADYVDPIGTTPRFPSLEFDRALLVLMDKDLQNYEIWLAESENVKHNLRLGRNDISVLQFRTIGQKVYPPALKAAFSLRT